MSEADVHGFHYHDDCQPDIIPLIKRLAWAQSNGLLAYSTTTEAEVYAYAYVYPNMLCFWTKSYQKPGQMIPGSIC